MPFEYEIAIHGGAGNIKSAGLTEAKRQKHEQALAEALDVGMKTMARGGNAVEAVEAAVRVLEDNPQFNAGKGAVLTHEEEHELDAAIMDGRGEAGGVASVRQIANPVSLARAVMESHQYVLLVADGAEDFARSVGMPMVDNSYFYTKKRIAQLKAIQHTNSLELDHTEEEFHRKHGTVGAVARDAHGNLASATSTGGLTNKKYRRVGDTPLIGAGTYADNRTCAVSATGIGEAFIRCCAAHHVSVLMEYCGMDLQLAAEEVVYRRVPLFRGEGGLITIDRQGHIAMPFNTTGMYRGFARSTGERAVGILPEDL
jgi:beta-aspartyl-peptidase (threonine type)